MNTVENAILLIILLAITYNIGARSANIENTKLFDTCIKNAELVKRYEDAFKDNGLFLTQDKGEQNGL